MSFLDDKQDIIKLELTTYGRLLLSKGMFKPVYYAFYDDDILYDSKYGDVEETQNSIQERILNETPSINIQTTFYGLEKTVNTNIHNIVDEYTQQSKLSQQSNVNKNFSLPLPLGNSSQNTIYSPSWKLNVLSGSIKSAQELLINNQNINNSLKPYLKVPQITFNDMVIDIQVKKNDAIPDAGYEILNSKVINSNTYYAFYKDDFTIVDISELNVDDNDKNFDIEIFAEQKYKNVSTDEDIIDWRQLTFTKPTEEIRDGILLDIPIQHSQNEDITTVEYYFEVTADDEIESPPKQLIGVSSYSSTASPEDGPYGEDC